MSSKLATTDIARFVLAGNATFTVVRPERERDGKVDPAVRFTFKVTRAKGEESGRPWFVKVLTGPDNRFDFEFAGTVFPTDQGPVYRHSKKARLSDDAPSIRCISWLMETLSRLGQAEIRAAESKSDLFPVAPEIQAEVDAAHKRLGLVEVWHKGKCGRCNRDLTTPESIANGFGPECLKKG